MRYQLMVLEQQSMIEKVGALCRAEPRLVAALMYGSFAQGEGDEHSDIDFYLFFDGDALGAIDRRGWLERIAPLSCSTRTSSG